MNVQFVEEVQRTEANGRRVVRRGVAVTKAFKAGDTIYTEVPIVSSLEIEPDQNGERNTPAFLAARFFSSMVHNEMQDSSTEYGDWDHLERMYSLKPAATDKERLELELIKAMIAKHVAGFGEFLTEERYMAIRNKITHNAIAIPRGESISAVRAKSIPASSDASKFKGRALYHITTFISHSCASNVSIRIDGEQGSRIALVATEDLKAGDELFVSYIDADMPFTERKQIIKSCYGFVCKCSRCVAKQ
eukprot:jgi/Hompol1/1100/HPOL_001633-RA